MDSSTFHRTLTTLGQLAEIYHHLAAQEEVFTDELVTALPKLEVAIANMINALLETEGQV